MPLKGLFCRAFDRAVVSDKRYSSSMGTLTTAKLNHAHNAPLWISLNWTLTRPLLRGQENLKATTAQIATLFFIC